METSAAVTASRIRGPDKRLSRPTATVRRAGDGSILFLSQPAKAAARRAAASSVRATGLPPVSMASPRISVPL